MILFLDYDGVLHPSFPRRDRTAEENQPFAYLSRLETVLRDFPEWQIVIASSWRENRPWESVIQPFSPDIVSRIVGATPVLRAKEPPYTKHPRHDEILQFISMRAQEGRWVVLDDDATLYPQGCPNLLICDDGFRDAEDKALRQMLKNEAV